MLTHTNGGESYMDLCNHGRSYKLSFLESRGKVIQNRIIGTIGDITNGVLSKVG